MLSRNHQAMGKGTRLDHMFCTAILRKWMANNTTASAPLVVSQKEEGTSTVSKHASKKRNPGATTKNMRGFGFAYVWPGLIFLFTKKWWFLALSHQSRLLLDQITSKASFLHFYHSHVPSIPIPSWLVTSLSPNKNGMLPGEKRRFNINHQCVVIQSDIFFNQVLVGLLILHDFAQGNGDWNISEEEWCSSYLCGCVTMITINLMNTSSVEDNHLYYFLTHQS